MSRDLGLPQELERVREADGVTPDDLRRVTRSALKLAPEAELLHELARRGGWGSHPSGELRLVLRTEAGREIEDLTPAHGWLL